MSENNIPYTGEDEYAQFDNFAQIDRASAGCDDKPLDAMDECYKACAVKQDDLNAKCKSMICDFDKKLKEMGCKGGRCTYKNRGKTCRNKTRAKSCKKKPVCKRKKICKR